ncbi:unnamed protein product, partial [Trichogramma brassicae]
MAVKIVNECYEQTNIKNDTVNLNYCIRDRRPDSRQHQPGARDRRIDSTAAAPAAAAQQPQHSSSSAASAPSAQQRRHSSSRATTAQILASIEISSAEVACRRQQSHRGSPGSRASDALTASQTILEAKLGFFFKSPRLCLLPLRAGICDLCIRERPSLHQLSSRDHQLDTRHHQPGVAVTDGQATAAQQQHNSSLAATTCTSIKRSSADVASCVKCRKLKNKKNVVLYATQEHVLYCSLSKKNLKKKSMFLQQKKHTISPAFTFPVDSSKLHIYKIQTKVLNKTVKTNITNIKVKMIKLSIFELAATYEEADEFRDQDLSQVTITNESNELDFKVPDFDTEEVVSAPENLTITPSNVKNSTGSVFVDSGHLSYSQESSVLLAQSDGTELQQVPKKSPAWEYFEELEGNPARCIKCNKIVNSSGNTSNLRSHLSRQHNIVLPKAMKRKLEPLENQEAVSRLLLTFDPGSRTKQRETEDMPKPTCCGVLVWRCCTPIAIYVPDKNDKILTYAEMQGHITFVNMLVLCIAFLRQLLRLNDILNRDHRQQCDVAYEVGSINRTPSAICFAIIIKINCACRRDTDTWSGSNKRRIFVKFFEKFNKLSQYFVLKFCQLLLLRKKRFWTLACGKMPYFGHCSIGDRQLQWQGDRKRWSYSYSADQQQLHTLDKPLVVARLTTNSLIRRVASYPRARCVERDAREDIRVKATRLQDPLRKSSSSTPDSPSASSETPLTISCESNATSRRKSSSIQDSTSASSELPGMIFGRKHRDFPENLHIYIRDSGQRVYTQHTHAMRMRVYSKRMTTDCTPYKKSEMTELAHSGSMRASQNWRRNHRAHDAACERDSKYTTMYGRCKGMSVDTTSRCPLRVPHCRTPANHSVLSIQTVLRLKNIHLYGRPARTDARFFTPLTCHTQRAR